MKSTLRTWAAAAGIGLGAAISTLATGGAAEAASCQTGGSFERWLDEFKQEAAAKGVSREAINAGLAGVAYDPAIIKRDRGQGVFQQTFLQFSDRMVSSDRMSRGPQMLKTHAALLARIEKQFGVPGPVLVAFWGLETDFGSDKGKYPILTSVATLAYDCRRADFFRPELMDALRVIQRGDLAPAEMIGDWAGEAGHMMMTPTDYYKYGIDYDGDGRADVIHSIPDALASAANFLQGLGWRRGEPWLTEVKVPANLPWDQADLSIQHSRAEWAKWGVTAANGSLPADGLPASLLLPMGRFGPAFLAYNNFQAYIGWNKAMVYSTTAAYYATRLAGAPPIGRGAGAVAPLSSEQLFELQRHLVRTGLSTAEPDGRLGLGTRAGVKAAQIKLGLPADSYPSVELIERLRTLK